MAALTLARSGATLNAVVSTHGSLATTKRAEPGAVTAKVLVCHGALDPHVPMTNIVAFADEMTKAGANWQVNVYGGAMHGFTHAHAVEGRDAGCRVSRRDGPPFVRGRAGLPGRSARSAVSRPGVG